MASTTTSKLPHLAPAVHSRPDRLVSLDLFRGLTIAGMILVTDPGTYSFVYPQLRHAEWNGATATDMIFPSFLFIVGVAMTLSLASRLERGTDRTRLLVHVLRRSALIFLLGLVLNGFPDYHLHTLRIPGILQRIALCYAAGSLLYLSTGSLKPDTLHPARRRSTIIAAVIVALLATYWALLKFVPVPGFGPGHLDSLSNLPAYIDRSVFGVRHLWPWGTTPGYGVTYDSEGILSTLPALATTLFGVLAGEGLRTPLSRTRKAAILAAAGFALALTGLTLSHWLPLNKRLLTPTFALFSSGIALVAFALCYFVLDAKRWRRGITPFLILGTNAILAFALSTIITTLLNLFRVAAPNGTSENLHAWLYHHLFATWLAPIHASLLYAIAIVLLNITLIYPLYRRRIFLRL